MGFTFLASWHNLPARLSNLDFTNSFCDPAKPLTECEDIAREIFSLLDMNKDKSLDDEDLRDAIQLR